MALALRPGQRSVGEQRRLTWDDLQQLPDDEGLRYELLDGVLLVSPAPTLDHQEIVGSLHFAFRLALPQDLKVFLAPTDWYVCEDTVFEPDLLVVRRSEINNNRRIEAAPVLVVEVLSPSTRAIDLHDKKHRYAKERVGWYWVVDPIVRAGKVEPRLTVFRLQDGTYCKEAVVTGSDSYEATEPFPVTIVPAHLLD